jgi:DNA-directed RNA polymerase subunit omega
LPQRRSTLMDPPVEDLLDKVDSKFTLVALSAKRARQINSYYNQLGEGLGFVVPPQVTSVSGKPLTIAFEEVAAGKATYHRIDPTELGEEGVEGTDEAAALAAAPELTALTGELVAEAVAEAVGEAATETSSEVDSDQPEAGE